MKRFLILTVALLIALPAGAAPKKQGCGVERAAIKRGTDPAAANVNMTPIDTTIADLRALPAPADIRHQVGRAPVELQVYTVIAILPLWKSEADSDRHLVISDYGQTMIAESVDPKCAAGSLWLDQITRVRAAFDQHFGKAKAQKNLHVKVRITGVGFFDFIHGQTGHAPSGIELHPITALEFLP